MSTAPKVTWRDEAMKCLPCLEDCPCVEGIRAHSEACQDERALTVAFLAPAFARARVEAVREVKDALAQPGAFWWESGVGACIMTDTKDPRTLVLLADWFDAHARRIAAEVGGS